MYLDNMHMQREKNILYPLEKMHENCIIKVIYNDLVTVKKILQRGGALCPFT